MRPSKITPVLFGFFLFFLSHEILRVEGGRVQDLHTAARFSSRLSDFFPPATPAAAPVDTPGDPPLHAPPAAPAADAPTAATQQSAPTTNPRPPPEAPTADGDDAEAFRGEANAQHTLDSITPHPLVGAPRRVLKWTAPKIPRYVATHPTRPAFVPTRFIFTRKPREKSRASTSEVTQRTPGCERNRHFF